MLTNKWVIVDKEEGRFGLPNTYMIVYVGEPNCTKTGIIKTTLDMQIGTLARIDDSYIKPLENLHNSDGLEIARVKLATCRNFYKNKSIKITLFGINYGIFEGVIHEPLPNTDLTRGDILTTALWKNPDNTLEVHIIKNMTKNMCYINDEQAKYTQEMVVLDADMAGAFDGQASYKHLLVRSYSGTYSIMVPSTSSFFSVHENDEVLVLDNQKDRWFEILDNKTINDVISNYVRQRQK